jgi:hypothetical protein
MKHVRFVFVALALSGASTAFGAGPSTPADKTPMSPKTRHVSAELKAAKGSLMAAVGACSRPDACDPQAKNSDKDATRLLIQSEDRFMSICQLCATQEQCEAERVIMRAGKRSRGVAPCR